MHVCQIYLILLVFTASFIGGIQTTHAQEIRIDDDWKNISPLYRNDTLTIRFFGDIMMHTAQIELAEKGFSKYFMHLEDKIKEADIAVANMEFTLAGKPYSGYPAFSAPDEYAEYLAESGFDIFLCANNHIFDKGSKGALRTLEVYKKLRNKYGIEYTGLAEDIEDQNKNLPLTITRKGIRISMVNMTYGTNLGATDHWPKVTYMNSKGLVENAISKAESSSDVTVVLPHWGTEYELLHSEQQKITAMWLVEQGADLIIGCHPHVVQDTTMIDGVPVAYSLGNLVSNMSAPNTQIGLMITVRYIRKNNGDIKMLPLELTHLWCSRPGGLTDSYTVIPVEEFIGKRDLWTGKWDYDKMISTYERIRKTHNNEH